MSGEQPNNPLHGVTLKVILEELVARHGWPELADRIKIRCFQNDPSLASSLKFLRKTDWARSRVEELYLADQRLVARNRKRNKRRAGMRAYRAQQEGQEPQEQADSPSPEDPADSDPGDAD
ncbi:MAG: DUF2132 domain-containing protein [Deltaproteobacteria bacterium]|nr:DUF2132 domain-containing protein [Deltaproteobacteria bacterium]